jgi:hypothetical protein
VLELKGQLSMEFMIVFVGMLMIAGAVTYPLYYQASDAAKKINKLAEAREAATTMANALNLVYASGPGSKQTVEYWLPKGVVNVDMHLDGDGVATLDERVSANGKMDVRVKLDFDEDNVWDNTRDSVVLVDTVYPSAWHDNGENRDNSWISSYGLTVQDWDLQMEPSYRTYHSTTFEYSFEPVNISDELLATENMDAAAVYPPFDLETTLFGYSLDVEADNTGTNDVTLFKLEDNQTTASGQSYILNLYWANIRVEVTVTEADDDAPTLIDVRYWASMTNYPYPRQIVVSDNIMERA